MTTRLNDHINHTIFHIPATLILGLLVSLIDQVAGICTLLYMVFIGTRLHSLIYQDIMEHRRKRRMQLPMESIE